MFLLFSMSLTHKTAPTWHLSSEYVNGGDTDLFWCQDILKHVEGRSCFADSRLNVTACAPLLVNSATQVGKGFDLPDWLITDCYSSLCSSIIILELTGSHPMSDFCASGYNVIPIPSVWGLYLQCVLDIEAFVQLPVLFRAPDKFFSME